MLIIHICIGGTLILAPGVLSILHLFGLFVQWVSAGDHVYIWKIVCVMVQKVRILPIPMMATTKTHLFIRRVSDYPIRVTSYITSVEFDSSFRRVDYSLISILVQQPTPPKTYMTVENNNL